MSNTIPLTTFLDWRQWLSDEKQESFPH
jgi:hypothetical protein